MIVDTGMYYAAIVVLAASLCLNIIQAGLVIRWRQRADQYKSLWKDAKRPIKPFDYEDVREYRSPSIHHEYLEGLD